VSWLHAERMRVLQLAELRPAAATCPKADPNVTAATCPKVDPNVKRQQPPSSVQPRAVLLVIDALLRDKVHQSPYGAWMLQALLAATLSMPPAGVAEPKLEVSAIDRVLHPGDEVNPARAGDQKEISMSTINVSPKDVMKLRDRTGLGMGDCKNALVEAKGDMDAAEKLIREKMKGKMDARTDRAAGEGCVSVAMGGGFSLPK
jgi:hypothetical protein